ncbi:hypothetical protein GCM10009797_38130 [Nocardioides hwasunensis]
MRLASATVLAATGAVALVPTAASAATAAIVTDAGCRTTTVARDDDGSHLAGALPATLNFYGNQLSNVYVNTNGNLTFAAPLTSFTGQISSFSTPLIAPFFADVDTRPAASAQVTYGTTSFNGRRAFCATWPGVGRFNQQAGLLNSFQVLLVDRSDVATGDFDIVLNYGQVTWDTAGNATPAQVGFSAGNGRSEGVYVFPGSGTAGSFLDTNTTSGLVRRSRESDVAGRYVFRFREGRPAGIVAPDTTITAKPAARSTSSSASFAYTSTAASGEHLRFECRLTSGTGPQPAFATCPDGEKSYADLAEGTYTFEVRSVDVFYSTDSTPASHTFTVDRTGPTTAITQKPASRTNDATASFAWSTAATDLASYECALTTAGDVPEWTTCVSPASFESLADGDRTFRVRASDDLGNVGAVTSYDFTVDTVKTGATITSGPEGRIRATTARLEYSFDPSDDVAAAQCRLFSGEPTSFTGCGADAYDATDLVDGDWTFEVRAVDRAGNVGDAASRTFTVDTTGPATRFTATPSQLTNDNQPLFRWVSDDAHVASYECRLTRGSGGVLLRAEEASWEACESDGEPLVHLGDGDWTYAVRATDDLGNLGDAVSYDFTIDTTAPVITFTETPETRSTDTTPTLAWSADEDVDGFECRLESRPSREPSAWEDCTSGEELTPLGDGDWRYSVRTTDLVGNPSEVTSTDFTIDTTGPRIELDRTPAPLSNDNAPRFAWTSEDTDLDSTECSLSPADGPASAWSACTDDYQVIGAGQGSYVFRVRGTDDLGNLGETTSYAFTIDRTPTDVAITGAPGPLTNDPAPVFGYEFTPPDDVATVQCRVHATGAGESTDFEECGTDSQQVASLADGSWTFEVRAIDKAGNLGEAVTYDFTVDTEAPAAPVLTSRPKALGNVTTPSFAWTSDADDLDHFECLLAPVADRAGTLAACDAAGLTSTTLADGGYRFTVVAVDRAGNASEPATYVFTIRTSRPAAPVLTAKPQALGNVSTPTFAWTSDLADVDHFECLVAPRGAQSGSPVACDAAGFTAGQLADGEHRFTVVAVDDAGNASAPTTWDFTVDTVAPGTSITTAPDPVVGTGSVSFGFAADEDGSTFECRLVAAGQTAAWEACAGASRTFTGLTDGSYTFEVRATDAAGNTDATPASRSVAVNLGLPTITAALTSEHPVSKDGWYRGAVTITYTCAGNGSAVVSCPAPRVVPRAQKGRVFTGTVSTADGDTATVRTPMFIDKGKPRARLAGFGRKDYSSVPKNVRCVASDPRSGLARCSVKVTKVTRKGGQAFVVARATAVDKAGNVRVVTKRARLRAS